MSTERARPAAVPDATSRELLAWLVRRRRRFTVVGPSMEPTLAPGDIVLLDPRAHRISDPEPGEIVVLAHPGRPGLRIVKRVEDIGADGQIRVVSDNLGVDAADSRTFGAVERSSLAGRVTARISR